MESTFGDFNCPQTLLQTVSWTNFTGLQGGKLSWWLASWPPKVSTMIRLLQCQFMLRNVCLLSWNLNLDTNHCSLSFYWGYSSAVSSDNQTQHGQARGEEDDSRSFGLACHCCVTGLPTVLASVSKPQCQHLSSAVRLMKSQFFHGDFYTWSQLLSSKCLWYFLLNHKRL